MGAGISTMFLLMDLGIGLAPFGLGPIVGATGFDTMYLILAGLVVIAAIYYFFVHGRFPKAKGHHLSFEAGKSHSHCPSFALGMKSRMFGLIECGRNNGTLMSST